LERDIKNIKMENEFEKFTLWEYIQQTLKETDPRNNNLTYTITLLDKITHIALKKEYDYYNHRIFQRHLILKHLTQAIIAQDDNATKETEQRVISGFYKQQKLTTQKSGNRTKRVKKTEVPKKTPYTKKKQGSTKGI
jgi:hypothetical protein